MRAAACLFLILLALGPIGANRAGAQPSVTGLWLTQDHDGVIAVRPCGAEICAAIVGLFLDRPTDSMPRDYRGLPQCGLTLIDHARRVGANLWKGHIMDPRNGSIFGVALHLDPRGNLVLRGYLGIPLLGQTQVWSRYNARVPADCRLSPADLPTETPVGTMSRPPGGRR